MCHFVDERPSNPRWDKTFRRLVYFVTHSKQALGALLVCGGAVEVIGPGCNAVLLPPAVPLPPGGTSFLTGLSFFEQPRPFVFLERRHDAATPIACIFVFFGVI